MVDQTLTSATTEEEPEVVAPDVSNLVTEDNTPVDNILSERQMRLLTESLYASWPGPGEGRTFVAMANVALYIAPQVPVLVPDVLLSVDVAMPPEIYRKEHRSYFVWLYGKPPDLVIEIVSNRKGGELGNKLLDYARMGVGYYVVYDPQGEISERPLRVFAIQGRQFVERSDAWFEELELGLICWEGKYEDCEAPWLRWCNRAGELLATGQEAAAAARTQAHVERERADHERERADHERERADRLAAQLRALGVDPEV